MYVNVIRSSVRDVVAICDDDLLGKRFEEGEFQLDVKESFYAGEKKSREETLGVIDFMAKEDATFNAVGEEYVKLLIEAGILKKEGVGEIGGVKFGLVLL